MSLRYDASYHMHCGITLESGRTVTVDMLLQSRTYGGLLEGVPDARANEWHVERAMRTALEHCVEGASPHLIAPVRRDYLRTPGDMSHRSSVRVAEWLPMVTCTALLKDTTPVREGCPGFSWLTIVWFQDEFAPPILEPNLAEITRLDWTALATDIEW